MTSPLANPADAVFQQAYALHMQSRLAEAQDLYRQTIRSNPQHFNAWHLLGLIALRTERPEEALELIGQAISLAPQVAGFHFNLANTLCSIDRLPEAVASYDRTLELQPAFAAAYCGRGLALERLGRLEEALASFEHAIAARPDHAAALCNRANVLLKLKRLDLALASYDRAIAQQPDLVDAYSNRSCVLREMQRFEEAIRSCDLALAMRANHPAALLNRGLAFEERGDWTAALADYDRALLLKPEWATAHFNRANVLCKLHDVGRALDGYGAALALDGNFSQARCGRATAHLLTGDFGRGWPEYEYRESNTLNASTRDFLQALRRGESLAGKTILVRSEGGFGDVIQFCRYVTLLAELEGRVILEAPGPLMNLLRSLKGVAQLVAQGDPLPSFDFQCLLMSLPLAFGTTLASVPARIPYLQPGEQRRKQWQGRCGPRRRPRVGLVWSGGRDSQRSGYTPTKKRRNVPLSKFAVLKTPQIEFFSLQKGPGAEFELAQHIASKWQGPDLIDLTPEINDFEDTAALMAQLDLVISVDTSVAHLAGALGTPVWILNRFDTCWRWMLGRNDSPWYPTVRLFRQERPGEWDGMIARVRDELWRLPMSSSGQPA